MKATKLASIFAVTAVAAAVSTTTVAAAEATFSGEAGVEYTTYEDESTGAELDGTKVSDIEIAIETGVVYAEIEIDAEGSDSGSSAGVDVEKVYVKQGDLSFGRFDGSVSTGAYMGIDEDFGGVDLNTTSDTDDTGIRYAVTPELTVAVEATKRSGAEDSDIGAAFSYVADLDGFKLGLSAGSAGDAVATNVGIQAALGSTTTFSMTYGVGEKGTGTTTDVNIFDVSLELNPTDDFYLGVNFIVDDENETDATYVVAEYTAGDLIYYAKSFTGDFSETTERTVVGVKAEF